MSAPTGETKVRPGMFLFASLERDFQVAPIEDKSAQFRVSATGDGSILCVYKRLVKNKETGRFEVKQVEMTPNLLIIGKQDGSAMARALSHLNLIIGRYENGMSRGLVRWVPPPPPPPPEDSDDEEMPELVPIEEEERKEAKPPSLD